VQTQPLPAHVTHDGDIGTTGPSVTDQNANNKDEQERKDVAPQIVATNAETSAHTDTQAKAQTQAHADIKKGEDAKEKDKDEDDHVQGTKGADADTDVASSSKNPFDG